MLTLEYWLSHIALLLYCFHACHARCVECAAALFFHAAPCRQRYALFALFAIFAAAILAPPERALTQFATPLRHREERRRPLAFIAVICVCHILLLAAFVTLISWFIVCWFTSSVELLLFSLFHARVSYCRRLLSPCCCRLLLRRCRLLPGASATTLLVAVYADYCCFFRRHCVYFRRKGHTLFFHATSVRVTPLLAIVAPSLYCDADAYAGELYSCSLCDR